MAVSSNIHPLKGHKKICGFAQNRVCKDMSTSVLPAEQRVIGVMVSVAASFAAGTVISGVSGVAGAFTEALSCWALLAFFLHLTDWPLLRPPVVRSWHAVALVCVTAAATWILVLPHVAKSIQTMAAFCPLCVLLALIAGPWHGLLPDSRRKPAARALEKERSSEDEQ